MAMLGGLINPKLSIFFTVSDKQIRTFDAMKWDSSARYATHDRHLLESLPEFTGTDLDKISFSMYLSAYKGADVVGDISTLINAERKAETFRLVLGEKAYGKNLWIITNSSREMKHFDRSGNLAVAKVDISLLAYAAR